GPHRSHQVLMVLFSCQKKLETLKLVSSDIHDLIWGDDEYHGDDDCFWPELDAFIGLRSLSIHLFKDQGYDDISPDVKHLWVMLQETERLESLSLRLVEKVEYFEGIESEELIKNFSSMLKFKSDCLRHVSLSGVA